MLRSFWRFLMHEMSQGSQNTCPDREKVTYTDCRNGWQCVWARRKSIHAILNLLRLRCLRSVMDSKIIRKEISDIMAVFNFFSTWSENPYFAKMRGIRACVHNNARKKMETGFLVCNVIIKSKKSWVSRFYMKGVSHFYKIADVAEGPLRRNFILGQLVPRQIHQKYFSSRS